MLCPYQREMRGSITFKIVPSYRIQSSSCEVTMCFFGGGFLPFPSPTFMANCLLMIKLSVKIGSLCNVHHAHQFYNNDNGIYEWISPFNPLFTIMT